MKLDSMEKRLDKVKIIEIRKTHSDWEFVPSKALIAFIKQEIKREREEIKEILRPSLDKLLPILQVNAKWAELHQEFGAIVICDDTSVEDEAPRHRPIKAIYYSPIKDFQEAVKIGGKLKAEQRREVGIK